MLIKNLNNPKVYLYYSLFSNLLIIGPIIVPFLLFKGLTYSQIMLLQSIAAIAVVIFEVPTGSIADKTSRKLSLGLGILFGFLGLLIYTVFSSFFIFVIAEIFFGLGMTFKSGADYALLYESFAANGRKKDYQKIEVQAQSLIFIGQAVGSIISGFTYKISPYIPFIISLFNLIIAGLVSFCFIEKERLKSEHKYLVHVFRSLNIAYKTPRILWAVLFAVLIGFLFRTSFWVYQPYFEHVNIDVMWFGVIFFFFNMMAAFSSKYLVKKFYDTRPRKVLLSLVVLLFLSFALPAIIQLPIALIFLSLQQIVRGLHKPTMRFYINHQVKDKYRATVISIVSLATSLGFAVLSPFVGLSLDNFGTIFTYSILAIFSLASLTFLFFLRKYQKR